MSRGIVFVAVGDQYVTEAVYSAKQAKSVMPEVNIALVTDLRTDADCFDQVVDADTSVESYGTKILNMAKTPYDKSIYLDTDAYVEEDISDIFTLLEEFEVAAAHKPDFQRRKYIDVPVPECLPEYNTGVIAFQKENFDDFIDVWIEQHKAGIEKGYPHDQPPFREALMESDIRLATLPSSYNCRYTVPGCLSGLGKVFHGRPKEIPYATAEFDRYIDRIVNDVNRTDLPRVFVPDGENGILVIPSGSGFHTGKSRVHTFRAAWYRFRTSLRRNGVKLTIRKSIEELFG